MYLLRTIGKGLERFYSFCGVLAALCLILLALCVLLSIGSRLVNTYIGGLTETAGYLMAAGNCLALAYTFKSGAHIRISLLISGLPHQLRHKFEIWSLMVASFMASYLAYYMIRFTYFSWEFEEVSEGADGILLYIPQSVTAFGTLMLAICIIHTLLDTIISTEKVSYDVSGENKLETETLHLPTKEASDDLSKNTTEKGS